MEARSHFTCIAYNTVDFLIQSCYVVSGIYLQVDRGVRSISFNQETLPHIYIGDLLTKSFGCSSTDTYNVVLVMKMQDFVKDVSAKIVDYTKTAFPASGNLALSVDGAISSKLLDMGGFRLYPGSIRARLWECGICAIDYSDTGRRRILISPDLLMKKFFATGMIKVAE